MILKSIRDINQSLLKDFSCGNKELDRYLKVFALENDINSYGKTYILLDDDIVVGFFTLSSASIRFEEFPKSLANNIPKYPISSVRIARLAVNKDKQGLGYGKELLKQAFIRILEVSETIGVRLIVVDAKETSISFYEKYGFQQLENKKLSYFLLIDTLKKAIE